MIKKFDYEYVTYEELYIAYLDCRKRKRTTINALEFEINENANLYKLWYELNTKTYTIGKSIVFCVEKPVKREVFAADFRDRVVHHLIINRINSILEDEFIDDSYSCRDGKGTDYGIAKCSQYITEASENYTKETYVIKCDLKSFFMTISKHKLYEKLCDFIKTKYKAKDDRDYDFIYYLLKLIIFNEPQHNCIMKQSWEHWSDLPKEKSLFFCEQDKGLPIGNLTSQIFANFYLSEFDHYVKEVLNVKYYGRYVDDFFIVVEQKELIHDLINKCREKLLSMGVTLHPKKLYIQNVNKGVKFIGAVIKPGRIYISNRTKGNMYDKLRFYAKTIDEIYEMGETPTLSDIEHFVGSINSYIGFMVHYKTFNIRKKLLLSEFMDKWYEYCYIDENLQKLTIFEEYVKHKGKKKRMSKQQYMEQAIDVRTWHSLNNNITDNNANIP